MRFEVLLSMSSSWLGIETQYIMMNPEIYAKNYMKKLDAELRVINYKTTTGVLVYLSDFWTRLVHA